MRTCWWPTGCPVDGSSGEQSKQNWERKTDQKPYQPWIHPQLKQEPPCCWLCSYMGHQSSCSFWSLLELAPGLCDQEKSHANHWKGREEANFEIPFPFSPKTFRVLCRVTNPISHQGFFCSFLHFLKQQNKQQARIDGKPFKRLSGVRVEKQRIEEQIAITIRIILLLLLVF